MSVSMVKPRPPGPDEVERLGGVAVVDRGTASGIAMMVGLVDAREGSLAIL